MKPTKTQITISGDDVKHKLAMIQSVINKSKSTSIQFNLTNLNYFKNTDIIGIHTNEDDETVIEIPYLEDDSIQFFIYSPMNSNMRNIDKKFDKISKRLEDQRLIDIDDLLYMMHVEIRQLDFNYPKVNVFNRDTVIYMRNALLSIYNKLLYKLKIDILIDISLCLVYEVLPTLSADTINNLNIVRMLRETDLINMSSLDTLASTMGYDNMVEVPADMFISVNRDGHPTLSIYDVNYEIKN